MNKRLIKGLNTARAAATLKRRAAPFGVVLAALALGACSGGGGTGRMPDGPNWSLADKPPVALGGSGAATQTASPDASPRYDYRGGRDPVTGKAAPIGGPAAADATPRLVEVRKGDTLHGLSLTYHVSVKALMDANHLATTTIVPGKRLVIPAS